MPNLTERIILKLLNGLKRIQTKTSKSTWRFKKGFNKDQLCQDLKRIKIQNGGVIVVHSSLSSLGKVEGGAKTVFNSIIEAFNNDITIIFPSYTLPYGTMEETLKLNYEFNELKSRTTLGAIPNAVLSSPLTKRSIHPTHSFVGIGPKLDELLGENHQAITPTGKGSPLYKMSYMKEAWLLLLGSPFGSFTSGHCVQDRISGFPYQPYSNKKYKAKCTIKNGTIVHINTYAHNTIASKFRWDRDEITRRLLKKKLTKDGLINCYKIGMAKCYLINCFDLEVALERYLKEGLTIFGSLNRLELDNETKKFLMKGKKVFWQR